MEKQKSNQKWQLGRWNFRQKWPQTVAPDKMHFCGWPRNPGAGKTARSDPRCRAPSAAAAHAQRKTACSQEASAPLRTHVEGRALRAVARAGQATAPSRF